MTAPTLVTPIPDQEHEPEAAVSFSVAANFVDAEDKGVLSFGATGLPSGLSISSSTGDITGSTSVAGTHPITVTATAPGGATRQTTFSIVVQGSPSAAQTYYVNGATGSDSWTGLSATFTSGSTGPWATITRANQVVAHASGHVDIMVAPGNYRNQPFNPQNAGTNNTHRIRLRVNGTGLVYLLGPSSGQINYAININVPFISVLRESESSYFVVDGEIVFGSGGGQVQKGDAPESVAHITNGIRINSSDYELECKVTRTAGWNAIDTSPNTTARGRFEVDFEQIGTCYYPDGNDFGDGLAIWRGNANAVRHLYDGGASGRFWNRIGHDPGGIYSGSGAIRGISCNNSWATVPTFSSTEPDGNRCGIVGSQNAFDVHAYGLVRQRNGLPQDGVSQNLAEIMKLEGTRNGLFDSVLRNGRMQGILSEAAAWSHHSRGCRIAHCVFDHLRGPLLYAVDWWGSGEDGQTPLSDFCMKNLVLRDVVSNPRSGWTNQLILIFLGTGRTMAGAFPNGILHGCTIQDATRDGDDFRISITGGDGAGNQTVTWWLANHPSLFSNFTFTADANLDNAPAASAEADVTDIVGEYLPVSDSLSIGQGVNLTQANGAGSSSTSLTVDDATWFDDPQDGAPSFGEQAGGFYVHINGVGNVQYTAINYVSKVLTLASGQTWADNAAVNRRIASGSAPNRGIRGIT
jgi:hypothetical protein